MIMYELNKLNDALHQLAWNNTEVFLDNWFWLLIVSFFEGIMDWCRIQTKIALLTALLERWSEDWQESRGGRRGNGPRVGLKPGLATLSHAAFDRRVIQLSSTSTLFWHLLALFISRLLPRLLAHGWLLVSIYWSGRTVYFHLQLVVVFCTQSLSMEACSLDFLPVTHKWNWLGWHGFSHWYWW